MEKRLLGGPADRASSRLVEQANIRAGVKRRYVLFGTISKFQAARIAVPSHRFRCLREIHVPAHWYCFACTLLWAVFLVGLLCPLSSVGWCCLASSFFGSWCFATLPDGLGVGLLGGWVGCCGVRWLGGSVLRAGSCVEWLVLALEFGC